jgi:hypothetical protein
MEERLRGQCHCGAVAFTVPKDAFGLVACHCDDCQKFHGNFFAMLVVDRDALQWEGESEKNVTWYASSAKARRSFCPQCGSRLTKDPVGSSRVMISIGLFGPAVDQRIKKHVFTDNKPSWYELPPTEG